MIADILIDYVNEPLDRLKVIEYLIYHDIPEIYAGDAKFNNSEDLDQKHLKEQLALEKINTFIPNTVRFNKIVSEYEERTSRESEFPKAVDCLDACIRNINNDSKTSADGFNEDLIRNKYYPHVGKFKITEQLFDFFMTKLISENKL